VGLALALALADELSAVRPNDDYRTAVLTQPVGCDRHPARLGESTYQRSQSGRYASKR